MEIVYDQIARIPIPPYANRDRMIIFALLAARSAGA